MTPNFQGFKGCRRRTAHLACDLEAVGVLSAAGVRVADLLDLGDAAECQVEGAVLKHKASYESS